MKSEKDYQTFEQVALLSTLIQLEKQRHDFVLKTVVFGLLTFGIPAALFFILKSSVISISSGLVLFLFWMLFIQKFKRKFVSKYKNEIIERIVHFLAQELDYKPKEGIKRTDFIRSNLFHEKIDRYKSEDLILGKIDKTTLCFAEIHAETKTSTENGSRAYSDLFRGMFFFADFNKNSQYSTVIVPDFFEDKLGIIGRYLQKTIVWGGKDPLVKLEDPEFEKQFAVYSSDQVEARYILSPSLMEKIKTFRLENGPFWMSFVDGNIFLAIPSSKNLFEPKLFKSMLNTEPLKMYAKYISIFIQLVDDLDMNTRIWMK